MVTQAEPESISVLYRLHRAVDALQAAGFEIRGQHIYADDQPLCSNKRLLHYIMVGMVDDLSAVIGQYCQALKLVDEFKDGATFLEDHRDF